MEKGGGESRARCKCRPRDCPAFFPFQLASTRTNADLVELRFQMCAKVMDETLFLVTPYLMVNVPKFYGH